MPGKSDQIGEMGKAALWEGEGDKYRGSKQWALAEYKQSDGRSGKQEASKRSGAR